MSNATYVPNRVTGASGLLALSTLPCTLPMSSSQARMPACRIHVLSWVVQKLADMRTCVYINYYLLCCTAVCGCEKVAGRHRGSCIWNLRATKRVENGIWIAIMRA